MAALSRTQHIDGDGEGLFRLVCEHGLALTAKLLACVHREHAAYRFCHNYATCRGLSIIRSIQWR